MDGSRFDDFARTFTVSRRSALKTLMRGAAAGIAAIVAPGIAGTAQGCAAVGRRCGADTECCSGLCDPASGQCVCGEGTEECGRDCVATEQYQTDVDNCGGCQNRCRRAPECQLPACLEGVCGGVPDPDLIGQPCGRSGGVCEADGACACPLDQPTACRTGCVDTASDPFNCGASDNHCRAAANGTAVCAAGVCETECNDGFDPCGEGCCEHGRDCCNGNCCRPSECCAAEGCVRCRCVIGIESFDAGEINPDNACQFCDPTRNRDDWTTTQDGSFCGEGRVCCNAECCSPSECCDGVQCTVDGCPDQCEIEGQPVEADAPNPANACQVCKPETDRFDWTIVDDQASCGGVPGRVCCNAECCSPTECCGETSCEECGPHCRIDGEDVDEGAVNPENPCEVCNPELDMSGWSMADDDTVCGGDLDGELICCAGRCCGDGQCCRDSACGQCACDIDGITFERDEPNPGNTCEVCNPDFDRDDWSLAGRNSPCGPTDDRLCCDGDCCPANECCNDIGECGECPCRIDNVAYSAGTVNRQNSCEVCDPDNDRDAWTALGNDAACGDDDDDRVCCTGACCEQGECCDDGSCVACGCDIDGDPFEPDELNPENSCQICLPGRSRLTWSTVTDETACGSDGGTCCGGECCPDDQCCILEACGTCLCSIGDDIFADQAVNPANHCEFCEPREDPLGWTARDNSATCGENDDQQCCLGTCCESGDCCVLGICRTCGCLIDDTEFDAEERNPENECLWCDPVLDPDGWSPADDTSCGPDGDRVCCGGICCAESECCSLDGVCEACQCEIEGDTFDTDEKNPANDCEHCRPNDDPIGWTQVDDDTPCGELFDRICCSGTCCEIGECCTSAGTCLPCRCEIDGATYEPGVTNSANECEVCDPLESATSWSPAIDDSPCAEHFGQVCCAGSCCPDGDCCTNSACGPCQPGCTIDGAFHENFSRNQANLCEECDVENSVTSWTPAPRYNNFLCGANLDQFCCNGICCEFPTCCNGAGVCELGGSPICAGRCFIGGVIYRNGEINPTDECLICDASASIDTWSFASQSHGCDNFVGVCCGGVCCVPGSGSCCFDDVEPATCRDCHDDD